MKNDKKQNILMLLINLFILASTLFFVVRGVLKGAGEGQVGEIMYGWGYLKAFTNLSNILAAVASAVVLFYNIRGLKQNGGELPRGAVALQYAASAAVGLTFVVVVFFLGPMFEQMGKGYFTMFKQEMFFFHFFNPVLCGIELVLLERSYILGWKENLIAMLPMAAYSVVYTVCVLTGTWSDFYNFTLGDLKLTAPAIGIVYAIAFLIAYMQRRLHNARVKRAPR